MTKIIDISHHQDPAKMDYDKLAKEVDLIIIRTQYGSKTIDRHYKTHHTEFQKRGVPTAAYAWVRGVSLKDMEVEATDLYNRTKEFNPTFWFLDVEEKSMSNMRSGTSAYLKKLRSLGANKVGIYIAHHHYKSFNLNLDEADAVWIPHYGSNNGQANSKPDFPCDIHQYTDKGRINGYGGDLDLNRIISDKSIEFFTGKTEEKVVEAPKTEVKPETVKKPTKKPKRATNNGKYKVVSGDTLGAISNDFNVSVNDLAKWNNIKNKNVIRVGQELTVVKPKSTPKYHKVVKGEVVSRLAIKYGSTINQIKAWNKLDKNYTIKINQKLRVK